MLKLKLNLKGTNDTKSNKYNQPPGTLNYTGEYTSEVFHGEVYSYNEENISITKFDSSKTLIDIIQKPENNSNSINWVNIIGLNQASELEAVGDLFQIDRLWIEDIVHVSNHSKVEAVSSTIFSKMRMMYIKSDEIASESLCIYKYNNFVITFQETEGDIFEALRTRITDNRGVIRTKNANYLYYSILDMLFDNYLKVLSGISYRIDDVEDKIIEGIDLKMSEIYVIKKELLFLKTTVYPIREVKETLQREDKNWLSGDLSSYMKDLNDHINQLNDAINSSREIVNNLFETHMLNINNDMNKVITTLTVFSAIFIPLSFLAGVFGMNFKNFPGLDAKNGIFIFIGGCLVIAVSMLSMFKIKKWF